jgi:hypothetical protein
MTKNAHLKLESNVPRCLCGAIKVLQKFC